MYTVQAPIRPRQLAAAAVGALILTGCTSAPSPGAPAPSSATTSPAAADLLSEHDLTGLSTAEAIERLDTMPIAERPAGLVASVHPRTVSITGGQGQQVQLPMPEDEVYISIAPYRHTTHECHFHSLTTCVGELRNANVHITLTGGSGETLIDETRRTYDNGFIGLWVPRGIKATLTIEQNGEVGTWEVSTTEDDDPTCITDLKIT
ncbi:CueP family metal-binding protein [Janibacter melonis]|uniref:CueP family metal-binding protein n=1 Tax=Janibacter melonis TaxID=262209 RepID=UPI001E457963|nr:CueP family metal-binding protein [Janibacter melonis]MCB5991752.1 CueP family metal-binding protein [Janibacter melonis]